MGAGEGGTRLDLGWHTFPVEDQVVITFSFASHSVSVTAVTDNPSTCECGCVAIKLYVHKEVVALRLQCAGPSVDRAEAGCPGLSQSSGRKEKEGWILEEKVQDVPQALSSVYGAEAGKCNGDASGGGAERRKGAARRLSCS